MASVSRAGVQPEPALTDSHGHGASGAASMPPNGGHIKRLHPTDKCAKLGFSLEDPSGLKLIQAHLRQR